MAILSQNEPIAVIGTGCRFPGNSTSPSRLWDLLREPKDVLTEIPVERFNPAGFHHTDGMHHGATDVHQSYLLSDDHRHFDAQFFNINPMEAHSMDPQQRLLLETVYESLEAAGLPLESLRGSSTSVFVGLMCEDYSNHLLRDPDTTPVYMATGTARSIMSNRISYFFDWHGPSLTIDTACSSSLVAVHQAVGALRAGESRMAIVAGANLIMSPEPYIGESKLKMLSPGSRSRMWDKDADGYARGDGIASIVLKTLSAALEDGDDIECVIRASGVNQDGRTKGITMPSAMAQASLIRETYAKVGLDPTNEKDRCHYFEAHGTGTPAGDPIEAEAINRVFFNSATSEDPEAGKLYVGSIKTVIGHTEGTAGLAGLIKASLALKNSQIPPNLLFNNLNPSIVPFYQNLEIPVSTVPWPVVTDGQPRRASVNSFGFGGTNAHVILESFESSQTGTPNVHSSLSNPLPFFFSAASNQSLVKTLSNYSDFLKANESLNLRDLLYTLHSRRSNLPARISISASSTEQLARKLDAIISAADNDIGIKPSANLPQILGIFTGQGAQNFGMCRELLIGSLFVQNIIAHLDQRLASLPSSHRPSWTLKDQILAKESESRINEAEISQPLCTAIQIVLIDLIHNAGINFKAVVGHSSGEIAAAYAAGYIAASDAIVIAYYRGFYAYLGRAQRRGAMLAAGTSLDDATELCAFPELEGRICVAACNSSDSVTLSGDADAIQEAQILLEDENKFARVLKVDTAYHSHHMIPCSDPYITALTACDIKILSPVSPSCAWYSSVNKSEMTKSVTGLRHTYWNDNMLNPVLFSDAIEAAIAGHGPFNLAIELGPHPALQGPTLQTIQDVTAQKIPYTGLLRRGKDATDTFSDALGFICENFGSAAVKLPQLNQVLSSDANSPRLLKALPTYPWDHERIFWFESRISRAYRTRSSRIHELLGTVCSDSNEEALRWRNLLRPSEITWLSGHRLQDQMIFPAAAYVVTAMEAATELAKDRSIKLLEVQNLIISRSITFEEDDPGVEIVFALANINTEKAQETIISADFTYHAGLGKNPDSLTLMASGTVQVVLGDPISFLLPPKKAQVSNLVDVDEELFYNSLGQLGYGYSGPFRALFEMKRKLDLGTGLLANPHFEGAGTKLMVHPGLLDAAFQSLFLAFCWPGDGSLRELHVPTGIKSIRINPKLAYDLGSESALPFDCLLTKRSPAALSGDVSIHTSNGQDTVLQIQGVSIVPFAPSSAENDRLLFSRIDWDLAAIDGELAAFDDKPTADEYEFASVAERTALWYMQNLLAEVSDSDWAKSEWHHAHLHHYVVDTISKVESGDNKFWKKEWLDNTRQDISELWKRFPNNFELELIRAVGENLPAAVRGEKNILEFMMHDNMLERLYAEGTGVGEPTVFLGRMAKQLAHRYPQTNILEIGAGTGGATTRALKEMGQAFASYTFTDISSGFFEKAQQVFQDYTERMMFKTLDIEKDIESQGFIPGSYDVIIASLVLHATKNIESTLVNVRRLLKPGGFLLLAELSSPPPLRMGFIFSGLPGWWLGVDDGRTLSPCINSAQWHTILRKTGFSGVDTITPEVDLMMRPGFVIASQAVDDRIMSLRRPLASLQIVAKIPELIIIGGVELQTSKLVDRISETLASHCTQIRNIDVLEKIQRGTVSPASVVLIITELDSPTFQSMTVPTLEGIKWLFDQARTVLWITRGCRAAVPYSNIAVGFGRSLAEELPHIRLQFLDFDYEEKPDANFIAESLLRGHFLDVWEYERIQGEILWSKEPEQSRQDGRVLVPRLMANRPRNDIYNSSRRLITKDVDLESSVVQLCTSGNSYSFVEQLDSDAFVNRVNVGTVFIKLTHSLLSPIPISATSYLYLVSGINLKTRKTAIAFAETNSSTVEVSSTWVLDRDTLAGQEAEALHLLGNKLIAEYIVSIQYARSTIVIHEPQPELASMLIKIAVQREVKIMFTTHDSENANLHDPWTFIHAMSSNEDIKQFIPADVALFIDLSSSTGGKFHKSVIEHCLSDSCKIMTLGSLFEFDARFQKEGLDERMSEIFLNFSSEAIEPIYRQDGRSAPRTIGTGDVCKTPNLERLAIVDWTAASTLAVSLQPVDSHSLFSADKTYILFGLTSNLGQSLVTWMVQRGAMHVVLTSRHPDIDHAWIQSLKRLGASIKVFASDITDKKALQKLCQEIRDSCPPIGGIANGAMVLQDTLIPDLDLETLLKVLKPKVDGSRYLDEIFRDDELDFCVFFSSLAGIYGNRGQANYSAANAFMAALAAQRRSRGQAASILHIGAVMGAGYVSREGTSSLLRSLDRAGWMWLSERDFHQSFAEAILLGRSKTERNCEVLVGVRRVEPDEGTDRQWFDNPKFQHCAAQQGNVVSKKDDGATAISLKSKLVAVSTERDAYKILKESFIAKLRVALQLQEMSEAKQDSMLALRADELGMDSLIAVEIRSWFLKEYQVDIQVLKILGGATIGEILDVALEKLPRELIPNVDFSDSGTSRQAGELGTSASTDKTIAESVTLSIKGEDMESNSSLESNDSSQELEFLRTEEMGYGQSRFWSLRSLLEDHTTFNIVCSGRISGPLRISQLEKAISRVAQVHEVLRTAFFESDNNAFLQGILPQSRIILERQHITNEDELSTEHEAMRDHKFDIEHGETLRIKVLSQSASSHFLVIGYHHIVMDGVSLEVFLSDVSKSYNDERIEPPALNYCDFSLKERGNFSNGRMNTELSFWRKEFPDIPPPLPLLPFSQTRTRRNLTSYDFMKADVKVNLELANRIRNVCRTQKATPFQFYLAAFKSLLFRILDTEEICIGMADANRTDNLVMESMGMFLNLLPLRFQKQADQEFKDALREARTKAYAALANGNVPFNILLEALDVPRSASHSPLFQAFINYRQGVQEKRPFGNCQAEGLEYQIARSSYDVSLDIIDNPGGDPTITFMLQKSLYSESDAKILIDCFLNLLDATSKNCSLVVSSIPIFSSSSIQEALVLGKGPDMDPIWTATTLCDQIDIQIEERKSDVAIKDGIGQDLTYGQMSFRINQIATALLDNGLEAQSTVGVFQEPTSEWMCSMLAIWRIGAIYVPFDTQNPPKRLEAIISDCKPAAILVHKSTLAVGTSLTAGKSLLIDVSSLTKMPVLPVQTKAQSHGIAAIIYTSGTTNTPKGIVLKHAGLLNQMEHYAHDLKIGSQVVMQQSAFSFDLSMWQIFMALTTGGSLVVVPKSMRRDSLAITDLIVKEGITCILATPSEFMSWFTYGSPLAASKWVYALSAGEALTQSLKHAFLGLSKSDLRLFNFYGPAEATISCHTAETLYANDKNSSYNTDSIPAGFAIRNTSTYIVDDDLQLVPVGFPGEVVIGGAGVSHGYLNNDVLTTRSFLKDPNASPRYLDKGWSMMHRTGDKGRLREDGALILGGRITGDTQIKLRGVRIDLQDVEAALMEAAESVLSQALVSFRAESQILIAHVVFSSDYPLETRDSFLKKLWPRLPLPQYMRPAMIIPLDVMPVTTHSKIDRLKIQQLPLPQSQGSTGSLTLTETEQQMKELWLSVLPREAVDYHDITADADFFYSGGNSGVLVRLQALIRDNFNVVLPLFEFFEASTLGAMASRIEDAVPEGSIDWELETSISSLASQMAAVNSITHAPKSTGRVVLLTGGTGFLGRKILQSLIDDVQISKIHCLVRQSDGGNPRLLPVASTKLVEHYGNLTAPLLGLTGDVFEDLAQEVDFIIHSGAQRSFWEYYQLLRNANVASTKELVKMAVPRKIPIHYISSGGVLNLGGHHNDNCQAMAEHSPPTDGSNGYVASKWASEKVLENAAKTFKIPVCIHRTLPATDKNKSSSAILEQFLKLSLEMNMLPFASGWTGEMDLLPIDSLAQGICNAALKDEPVDRDPRYLAYRAEVKLTGSDLSDYLERNCGDQKEFGRMAALEWVGKIKSLGFGYFIASQKMTLNAAGKWRKQALTSSA